MNESPLEMYPVTIFRARYSGVYEGGEWVALHKHPDDISPAAVADDVSCSSFFDEYSRVWGRGATPMAALEDLFERSTDE